MTPKIKAIKALQASIKAAPTAEMDEIVEFMGRHTGLNEGEIWLVLMELRDAIVSFTRSGQATRLPGLGTFTPTLRADGDLHLNFRPAVELKKALRQIDYSGSIHNHKNRGKSAAELVALWNDLHPDDPVEN